MSTVVEITSPHSNFHQKIFCQTISKAKWPFEGGTYFLYFPSGDYKFCNVRGLRLSIWWKGNWCKNHFGPQSQILKLGANSSCPKNCPIMSSRTNYCPLLVMATAWDSIDPQRMAVTANVDTFRAGMLLPKTASKKTMGKSLNHRNRLTYLANFFPLIRHPSASVVKPAPVGECHLFSQDWNRCCQLVF